MGKHIVKDLSFSSSEFECIALYSRNSIGSSRLVNEKVETTSSLHGYLPVIKNLGVLEIPEMGFEDPKGKKSNVPFHNSDLNARLGYGSIRAKRFNSQFNDVLLGDVKLILNFTDKVITTRDRRGAIKTYDPLDTDLLGSNEDCILVLSLETHNVTTTVKKESTYADGEKSPREYMTSRQLFELLDQKSDDEVTKGFKELSRKVAAFSEGVNEYSNSIVSVSLLKIEGSDVTCMYSGYPLFVPELEVVLSTMGPMNIPVNPLTAVGPLTRSIHESYSDKLTLSMFLVDNHDHIGDRWVSVVDDVIKIPSTKNSILSDGLYITKSLQSLTSTARPDYTLDEVEAGLPFIFKTKEEAKLGLDAGEITKREDAKELRELNRELTKEKHSAELEVGSLKKQITKLQLAVEEKRTIREESSEVRKDVFDSAKVVRNMEHETLKNELEKKSRLLSLEIEEAKAERERAAADEKLKRELMEIENKRILQEEKSKQDRELAEIKKKTDSDVSFYKTLTAVVGAIGVFATVLIKISN